MVQDVRVKKPDLSWVSIVGPQGPTGVSTIIVGSFGPGTGTPATLPPDGALVAGFTAPGSVAYQMVQGESLYYEAPTGAADPLDGHLFQYVTTTMNPAGWIDVGLIQGPVGPEGPIGPQGPELNEVFVGPDDPIVPWPDVDIWVDSDAPNPPPSNMDDVVLKSQVYHSPMLLGPWTELPACTWTVDLAAGTYMLTVYCATVATTAGARGVNVKIDGTNSGTQAFLYFNEVNSHRAMTPGVGVVTVTAGTHVFTLRESGSCQGDANDRSFISLIPVG